MQKRVVLSDLGTLTTVYFGEVIIFIKRHIHLSGFLKSVEHPTQIKLGVFIFFLILKIGINLKGLGDGIGFSISKIVKILHKGIFSLRGEFFSLFLYVIKAP